MSTAPWRNQLNECINQNMKENKDSISYAFSTVSADGIPRNRFVVHRGFVNERRKDDDPSNNDASKDFTSDVMLFTTDARGPKAQQILSHKDAGCPCEIAWWFEPTGEQYRIQGRAFLLSRADHANTNKHFPAKRLSPQQSPDFDWEQERLRIYDKMSPPLKASFIGPVPGTPLKDTTVKMQDLPQKIEDPEKDKDKVAEALLNFSLVAIEPVAVDYCKLKVVPNERSIWRKEGNDWQKEDVRP